MTDATYRLLAKQFVDMWQQQLAHMLVDERFVANLIDTMNQPGGFPHAATPGHDAAATDAANPAMVQLERRLAASEARIAELEREMAALRRAVPARPGKDGKRRTSGTGKAKHQTA